MAEEQGGAQNFVRVFQSVIERLEIGVTGDAILCPDHGVERRRAQRLRLTVPCRRVHLTGNAHVHSDWIDSSNRACCESSNVRWNHSLGVVGADGSRRFGRFLSAWPYCSIGRLPAFGDFVFPICNGVRGSEPFSLAVAGATPPSPASS